MKAAHDLKKRQEETAYKLYKQKERQEQERLRRQAESARRLREEQRKQEEAHELHRLQKQRARMWAEHEEARMRYERAKMMKTEEPKSTRITRNRPRANAIFHDTFESSIASLTATRVQLQSQEPASASTQVQVSIPMMNGEEPLDDRTRRRVSPIVHSTLASSNTSETPTGSQPRPQVHGTGNLQMKVPDEAPPPYREFDDNFPHDNIYRQMPPRPSAVVNEHACQQTSRRPSAIVDNHVSQQTTAPPSNIVDDHVYQQTPARPSAILSPTIAEVIHGAKARKAAEASKLKKTEDEQRLQESRLEQIKRAQAAATTKAEMEKEDEEFARRRRLLNKLVRKRDVAATQATTTTATSHITSEQVMASRNNTVNVENVALPVNAEITIESQRGQRAARHRQEREAAITSTSTSPKTTSASRCETS